MIDDLAGRTMKRRAHVPGLNPDRADTIVGGALVIQGIARHLGADRTCVVSSRGLREGLALATDGGSAPSPEWVRSISVATLAARFRTWSAAAAERRTGLAADLLEALDPSTPPRLREMLSHAATLLDIGRAIDYYDRFEHAANIVIAADLAGFSHADLGTLTAILRQADDDTRLGPYGRLVPERRSAGGAASCDRAHARGRAQPPHPTGRTGADLVQLDARRVRGGGARAERVAPAQRRATVPQRVRQPTCSWSRTNRRRCSPRCSSPTNIAPRERDSAVGGAGGHRSEGSER